MKNIVMKQVDFKHCHYEDCHYEVDGRQKVTEILPPLSAGR
ncbi:hypothetical protein [Castellaniella defragrans]|uniref:Uncharacterized protein n=1 Tax=Castellaniella defragrans TaxID=75697 RepID=A0A7W9TR41_CASDE|nr:hypothetical protein [Castellaniella defragrans]MBB6085345.1 hypothetical protein [Castellaniella defragrans]